MVDAHSNFAYSLVVTAPSPATTGTTLDVRAGEGALFPAVPFNATVWPAGSIPSVTNAEVVRVTNITVDTLTITRTQEGTSARAIVAGDQFANTITAGFVDQFAAKTAAIGPIGSATTVPSIEVLADGSMNLTTNALVIPHFGQLTSWGHSYTQTDGYGVASFAPSYNAAVNFTHRLAAMLNIPSTEVKLYGKGGGQGASPYLGDGPAGQPSGQQGVGVAMTQTHPSHMYSANGFRAPRQSSKARPSLHVVTLGYNEPLRSILGNGSSSSIGPNATQQGYRTWMSWLRLKAVYFADDTSLTYGGAWNPLAVDRNYVPGRRYKKSTTDASYAEIALPTTFLGGTVAFYFMAGKNALATNRTTMTSSVPGSGGSFTIDSGSLGLANTGAQLQELTGNFVIQIGTEQILCNAGGAAYTVVTRGYNGTTAAAHADGALAFRPTTGVTLSTGKVTFSGTCGGTLTGPIGGSGSTVSAGTVTRQIAGQGSGGDQIQIVQRIDCTSADAGKTIRATISGMLPGETFEVLGWGIEDEDPPVQVWANQFSNVGAFYSGSTGAIYNNILSSVASEFSSGVYVSDIATPFATYYGATVQTNIADDHTNVNHAAQTIHITPNDAANCVINVGSVIKTASLEEMLVTAITKTSGTDWSLTVTRNYTGEGSNGVSIGTTTAVSVGTEILDTVIMSYDRVHPSDLGHNLFAAYIFATISAANQTNRQTANSGGYIAKLEPSLPSDAYIWLGGATTRGGVSSGTNPNLANSVFFQRLWIPQPCVLLDVRLDFVTTAASGGGRSKILIHSDGGGCPADMIWDSGFQTNPTSVPTTFVYPPLTGPPAWIPLERGFIWVGYAPSLNGGTIGAIRCGSTFRGGSFRDIIGFDSADPSGTAWDDIIGLGYNILASVPPVTYRGTTPDYKVRSGNTAPTGGLPSLVLHIATPDTGH